MSKTQRLSSDELLKITGGKRKSSNRWISSLKRTVNEIISIPEKIILIGN